MPQIQQKVLEPRTGRKITIKGKRVKVPTFLPQGKNKRHLTKNQLEAAYHKQQEWLEKNQTAFGRRTSEGMKNIHKRSHTMEVNSVPVNGTKTDLGFLNDMFKRKTLWGYDRTIKMVKLLRDGKTIEQIASKFDVNPPSVKNMVQELKRANDAGFNLEDYFRKDRPCRYGKKVLAK